MISLLLVSTSLCTSRPALATAADFERVHHEARPLVNAREKIPLHDLTDIVRLTFNYDTTARYQQLNIIFPLILISERKKELVANCVVRQRTPTESGEHRYKKKGRQTRASQDVNRSSIRIR